MPWKPIPKEKYLKLCGADFKIVSTKLLQKGVYGRMLEVIMGINGVPQFKHTINPNFEVETYRYEEDH